MKTIYAVLLVLVLGVGCGDPNEKANELYVEAVKLISSAEGKKGEAAIKDYEKAVANLRMIVDDYSKSDLAVKLVSGEALFTGKSLEEIEERVDELRGKAKQLKPLIAFTSDDTWLEELNTNKALQESFMVTQGKLVEIQPADTGADPERIAAWLEKNKIAGVLLASGGDVDPRLYGGDPANAVGVNRARDDFEIALIKVAMEKKLPILGICRGCQILNVARGGTLRNMRDDAKLKSIHFNMSGHAADLAEGSRLSGIMGANRLAKVQSLHDQAVGELGRGLRVSATGPGGVIEAIEGTGDVWVVAVQWHPELSVNDPKQNALLKAFVTESKSK